MKFFLLAIPLLFVSCVQLEMKVTTFHSLPEKGSGETFAFYTRKDMPATLENRQYMSQVVAGLESYGWTHVEDGGKAQYRIYPYWGITDPTVSHSVMPIMGQTGGGTSYHSGTYGGSSFSGTTYSPPTYGVIGSVPVTTVLYGRYFFLTVKDRSGQNVLESNVTSLGSSGHLNVVLPTIIKTYFENFPGQSGKTKAYRVPLPQ